MDDYYTQLATSIINTQEELIGSVAWQQASLVEGLIVNDHVVKIVSLNPSGTIDGLVNQYGVIFGPAAVEVCKQAARRLTQVNPEQMLPTVLR